VGVIGPLTPSIIGIIGLSGMFGGSMVLSLLSDFLSFMTIHIYLFYMVAAKIFNWQLTILYSLFNLFQGTKCNSIYRFLKKFFLTGFFFRQKMEHFAESY
jgi:phosphatidylinositol N-acetylglucosaminyltransferase subunit Q